MVRRYAFLLLVLALCSGILTVSASPPPSNLLFHKVHPSLTEDELEGIYQCTLDQGVRSASLLAAFLLREDKDVLHRGEIEEAVVYAEYAQKLAPHYPPVYTHLGEAYWRQNRFRIFSLVTGWVDLLKAIFDNYFFTLFMLINFSLFLLCAFFFTCAVFSLALLSKYFKLFIHDLNHFLPLKLPQGLLIVWGMVIFALPFFIHVSIFLIFFYWLLLLFIYHSKREQQIVIVFAFFLLLSPFIIQFVSYALVTSSSGISYQVNQVNEETWDDETEQKLVKWNTHHPHDVDVLFTLGLLKKREGEYGEAKKYYEEVLEIVPTHHRALCNLGNVLLATQKVDMAIESYNRCLELFPTSVECYYNLSRAYLLQYMFDESTTSFSRAREIDAQQVDYYSKIYSTNMNRMVIDCTLPLHVFWETTLAPSEEKRLFNAYLWGRFFNGIPFSCWYCVLLVVLLFVCLLFVNHRELGFSVGCEYCGVAVCRRCRRSVYGDHLCKQCAAIFKGRGDYGISAKERERKVVQIEHFQKRYLTMGRILSMILPGAGHLWIDYPLRGSAMLFLFFFLLLRLIYGKGIVVNPWLLNSDQLGVGSAVVCGVLLLLYLYSILNFIGLSRGLSQFLSLIRVTRKELQIKK